MEQDSDSWQGSSLGEFARGRVSKMIGFVCRQRLADPFSRGPNDSSGLHGEGALGALGCDSDRKRNPLLNSPTAFRFLPHLLTSSREMLITCMSYDGHLC